MITVNRVDALGKKTGNYEGIVGVVSGNNLINCLRGVEGTAQAWTAGKVVEILVTADDWNDLIDGFLVAFNQDGTIKNSTVLTTPVINTSFSGNAKAAGSDITTGTNDTKIVTPKAIADSYISALPSLTSTSTLTNKRITPRVVSATNYTTDTGTSLNCATTDIFIVTAQAGALKLNNPTGTPTDGQKLWVAVTGTGARVLTYDTQFEASGAVALPTTTVGTARLDIGFVWRADTSKWHCMASS